VPSLLVADDSLAIGRAVELAFANEGVAVTSVLSGTRAMEALRTAPPDLVLADASMARINGYDIAAYVKATPSLANIPVLLLAEPFEPFDEARARAAKCDGVILKPFDPAAVVALVQRLLRGDRPAELWPADLPPSPAPAGAPPRSPLNAAIAPAVPPPFAAEAPPSSSSAEAPAVDDAASSTAFETGLDRLDAVFSRPESSPSAAVLDRDAAAAFAGDVRSIRSANGERPTPRAVPRAEPQAPAAPPPAPPAASAPFPAASSAPADHLKIRVKIGANEFDAEGPADVVRAEFDAFKRLVERKR